MPLKYPDEMKKDIKRAIEHITETNHVRKVFWHMDEKVEIARKLAGIEEEIPEP